jgi:hypothetical protein
MADLRSTVDLIKKRKKAIEDAMNEGVTSPPTVPQSQASQNQGFDSSLISPEAAAEGKRKAQAILDQMEAEKKKRKGWLW